MLENNEVFLLEVEIMLNHAKDKSEPPVWVVDLALINVLQITFLRKSYVVEGCTDVFYGGQCVLVKGKYEDVKKRINLSQKNAMLELKKEL